MASAHFGSPGPPPGIAIPRSDFAARSYNPAALTETWTFRIGGAAGVLVATITIVYDGSDKIVTVTET